MSDHELRLYESVASALDTSIVDPDLLIYLRSDVARLVANIQRRGRAMERGITEGYLQELSEAYTAHILHRTTCPTIIVDMTNVDFVNDSEAVERLIDRIEEMSSERIRYMG